MSNAFNENDIRPDELVKQQAQYCKHDIDFLKSKKGDFIDVKCPACEQVNSAVEMTKHSFNYIKCKECGMLYISPRPTVEILNEYYPNSPNYKFFNDYIFPASKEIRRNKIFKPRVEKVLDFCNKFGINKNKIIEIGTGFGLFCEEMAKANAFNDVVGVEASDSLAKTCQEKGFRIYNGLLENLDINETFDVAVAFEVIEHIFNPKYFLKKISSLLNKNGLLMLTFPNWEGFDIQVLREFSCSIDPEHLNYFTEKSISILLKTLDFEVLEILTPGELDVDIVSKTIIKENLKVSDFVRKICVEQKETTGKNFQEFLKKNRLSSHMMVIARKIK